MLIFSIYSIGDLQSGTAQIENWKKYDGLGKRFTFLYPPNWMANTTHVALTISSLTVPVNFRTNMLSEDIIPQAT
jgi:hypothetical protein